MVTGQLGGEQRPLQLCGQLRQVARSAGDPSSKAMSGTSMKGSGDDKISSGPAAAPAGADSLKREREIRRKGLGEVLADMYRSFLIVLCFKAAKPLEQ